MSRASAGQLKLVVSVQGRSDGQRRSKAPSDRNYSVLGWHHAVANTKSIVASLAQSGIQREAREVHVLCVCFITLSDPLCSAGSCIQTPLEQGFGCITRSLACSTSIAFHSKVATSYTVHGPMPKGRERQQQRRFWS